MDEQVIFTARARVLADLRARSLDNTATVTALEEACTERRWWLEQWAEGAAFIGGLIAQDVQDTLADRFGRHHHDGLWPVCATCAEGPVHALHIEPDIGGPDPVWVCEESGTVVAPLGGLTTR